MVLALCRCRVAGIVYICIYDLGISVFCKKGAFMAPFFILEQKVNPKLNPAEIFARNKYNKSKYRQTDSIG